jgi:hypothetical protein
MNLKLLSRTIKKSRKIRPHVLETGSSSAWQGCSAKKKGKTKINSHGYKMEMLHMPNYYKTCIFRL